MFRIITILAVLIVIALALTARRAATAARSPRRLRRWDRWVFGAMIASALALAGSGFAVTLILAQPLSGLLLILHTGFGALFVVSLAILAIGWAEPCRLTEIEFPQLAANQLDTIRLAATRQTMANGSHLDNVECFDLHQKIAFWCLILFGFISTITILLCMIHLFGTQGQGALVAIHRYSGLALVLVGIDVGVRRFRNRPVQSA